MDFWCDGGVVTSLLGKWGRKINLNMKTIYGMQAPDEEKSCLKANRLLFKSPRDAIARGIQMVHQHFMLIEELTVAENIVMGKEPKMYGLFDRKEAERQIVEIADTYGFRINPAERVCNLSVGEKQRVKS